MNEVWKHFPLVPEPALSGDEASSLETLAVRLEEYRRLLWMPFDVVHDHAWGYRLVALPATLKPAMIVANDARCDDLLGLGSA